LAVPDPSKINDVSYPLPLASSARLDMLVTVLPVPAARAPTPATSDLSLLHCCEITTQCQIRWSNL